MAEPVEVAINAALIARAQAFATAQGIAISLPNIAFPGINPDKSPKPMPDRYLRATFLPAPSFSTGIGWDSHAQHYGLLQLDLFWPENRGEYEPGRIVSEIIQYFARGTELVKDGFRVRIHKQPYRGPLIIDGVWAIVPTTIPFQTFATA